MIDIEEAARTIARHDASARHDEARINFQAEWGGMKFRATGGAGTNSCSVARLDTGETLYQTHDHGRAIKEFHPGPWCDRVCEHAAALNARLEAQKYAEDAAAAADWRSRFRPTEF